MAYSVPEFVDLVSKLGLGGFLVLLVRQLWEGFATKKGEIRAMKQEAYARAVSTLSRLDRRSFEVGVEFNEKKFNHFVDKVSIDISSALLYSNEEVHDILKKFFPLLTEVRDQ